MSWTLPSWLRPADSTNRPSSSSSPSTLSNPSSGHLSKSSDGGLISPDRSTRETCYISRDLFFECLDRHQILDAVKEDSRAKSLCGAEHVEFERDCARSWIKYFKEKRVMEWKRDETIKQIQKEDQGMIEKNRLREKAGAGGGGGKKGLFG